MLATNSYARRNRLLGLSTVPTAVTSGSYLVRPRLSLRSYLKPKSAANASSFDVAGYGRSKRSKSRKINGLQKMDTTKKKTPDYTEMAYREAVAKLKYLLAESYVPRITACSRNIYQGSDPRTNESGDDTDDRSIVSDSSRTKGVDGNVPSRASPCVSRPTTNVHLARACSNAILSAGDRQSVPPELTSFIERQEEYIEQLERESQYCRDELTNLLGKVREVVAENEALHDKNKNGYLRSVLEECKSSEEENEETNDRTSSRTSILETKGKRVKLQKVLEGPSIVFESRISELEAQLTQARVELRKAREENQANSKRLSDSGACSDSNNFEIRARLDEALRDKREAEMKLEESQRNLTGAREREADTAHKAKRALDVAEQAQFEKAQAEAEIRRSKDELDRQREKLREAAQETTRRIAEERHQVERRYSQQVEQLSADIASHWDVASKSQLESEKQRREIADLGRDLAQKQALIDDLKKELQSKISSLQSDLSQVVAEKDAAEQEVSAARLSIERSERQTRQEQNRLQAEINSYKQRLERADADLVHCRRENLRLSEQIASLEKEISMNKMIHAEESRTPIVAPRPDKDKELTSMIMDMETKHAATVASLEDALTNQATLVSRLTAECQSLTHRMEANSLEHKDEMASLQNNIEYLSTKIQDSFDNQTETSNHKLKPYNYDIILSNGLDERVQPLTAMSKESNLEDGRKSNEKFHNLAEEQFEPEGETRI